MKEPDLKIDTEGWETKAQDDQTNRRYDREPPTTEKHGLTRPDRTTQIHLAPRTDRKHHQASQEKHNSSQTKPETTPQSTWERAAAKLEQRSRSKDRNFTLLLTNK
ncbi:hypothetical protein ISN44_As09g024920 [Arabidopsis suecica]|uniref:Uncharacterized protein n=1 Tax=Arabidopsis suecica TaxID=45249 RepID=A0A8T2AMW3_ARASU|nr:hypothetical protein ISN44_As09g024920 [Arabidopsis suecica]